MDGALVQLTHIIAASVYGNSQNRKQRGVSNRLLCNRTVQMRSGLSISAPSLSLLIGGTGFNKLQPISISASRGRGTRYVARAMLSSFEKFSENLSSRFTAKGIEVIKLAHEESRRMGHNYVGTEQILLGLISQGTGIAGKVLKSIGISSEDARVEVEKIVKL
ncbi:chaperone protein ClpC1, chloroplastic-like isoform X2 [Papaver somniferum]|nr:chaperone protein ClpC1, chloroplastic-like isoform X2 [Papaver somniferum]XP_026398056.1 chaperone protein ClpC1, chloroplastic-like isoform X2 [Papaver somniferum]